MEDYIYLILVAVAWVVGAIYKASQRRKKKSAPLSTPVDNEEHSPVVNKQKDFKSILEEVLLGEEFKQDTQVVDYEEQEEISVLKLKDDKKNSPIDNKQFRNRNMQIGNRIISEDIQKKKEYNEIDDIKDIDFDLRKAVIYSEILNRPYA